MLTSKQTGKKQGKETVKSRQWSRECCLQKPPSHLRREISGYEVPKLADTVSKAKAAGATVLVGPYTADGRQAAIPSFPGNYIAEVHAPANE
jgi:hypothetical protein